MHTSPTGGPRVPARPCSGSSRVSTSRAATPIAQLTSSYMAGFGRSAGIGACPVTALAGTGYRIPAPSSQVSDYYNPSDGLVGQAAPWRGRRRNQAGGRLPAPGFPQRHRRRRASSLRTPSSWTSVTARWSSACRRSPTGSCRRCRPERPRPRPATGPAPSSAGRPQTLGLPLRTLVASSPRGRSRPGQRLLPRRPARGRPALRLALDVGPAAPGADTTGRHSDRQLLAAIRVTGGTAFVLHRDPRRAVALHGGRPADHRRHPRHAAGLLRGRAPGRLFLPRVRVDGRGRRDAAAGRRLLRRRGSSAAPRRSQLRQPRRRSPNSRAARVPLLA